MSGVWKTGPSCQSLSWPDMTSPGTYIRAFRTITPQSGAYLGSGFRRRHRRARSGENTSAGADSVNRCACSPTSVEIDNRPAMLDHTGRPASDRPGRPLSPMRTIKKGGQIACVETVARSGGIDHAVNPCAGHPFLRGPKHIGARFPRPSTRRIQRRNRRTGREPRPCPHPRKAPSRHRPRERRYR